MINEKFPHNFGEQLVFSITMCLIMVIGMLTYNLYLNDVFSLQSLKQHFLFTFMCAYILNSLIILKITKYIMVHLARQIFFPVINVAGMVLVMSFIGLAMEVGFEEYFVKKYFVSVSRNYFIALFLQLFVASPLSMLALKVYRIYKK